ncbi:MAG: DUF1189 family protein [Bdellovibrionales bacterium]|jgi:hypothetical protein
MTLSSFLAFLKELPQTFYSSDFYQRLMTARKGFGLGFILVATLISVLQLSLIYLPSMRPLLEESAALFQELPEVTLDGGLLTVKGETPQTFTLLAKEEGGPVKVMLDLNADMTDETALQKKMADEKILFIAGKDHFAIYNADQKTLKISPFDPTQKVTMTHENWISFGENLKALFLPFSSLTLAGLVFMTHLFTAFLGAILILIVAPLFKIRPALPDAMRLSAAAKIPVAVIFVIATPYPPLQAALWFGFVAFGLLAARRGPKITQG